MKFKYKTHVYQTAVVQAVADCFKGSPPASAMIVSIRTPETEIDLYNAVAAQISVPVAIAT